MMCSRGGPGEIRSPTYQYHPRFLLYQAHSAWHLGTLHTVARRIHEALPGDLQTPFQHLLLGRTCPHEQAATQLTRWIETQGPGLGFRPPNPRERARATGRGHYLAALGLNPRQLYDAVGNHSDADAIIIRVADTLREWQLGQPSPPGRYAAPAHLHRQYMLLRRDVLQANYPACTHPFPEDLRALLLVPPPHFLPPISAAEHGRAAG